jgi:hypothetical protein
LMIKLSRSMWCFCRQRVDWRLSEAYPPCDCGGYTKSASRMPWLWVVCRGRSKNGGFSLVQYCVDAISRQYYHMAASE